jgi:ribosomal protein S18 acetylase RimI-like enzyme
MIIKKITAAETFLIRHQVLRKGKPIETCLFEGDNFKSTNHFGLFVEHDLVAVVSLFECPNTLFKEQKQFQIRGMAVLEEFQKKGFGDALIKHIENHLNQEKSTIIWFNARETATGFYQKLGYTIIGDSFEIKDVGLHFLMIKKY